MNTEEKKKEALNLIEKVKSMFVSEKEKTKFEEVTTEDGTVLFYNGELAEGTEIFVVVKDKQVLASEGTFVLENGTEVTVDAEGKVVSIVEATTEETEDEQEETFSRDQVDKMLEDLRSELTSNFEVEKAKDLETLKEEFAKSLEEAEKEVNAMFADATKEQPKKKKVELGLLSPRQRALMNNLDKKK